MIGKSVGTYLTRGEIPEQTIQKTLSLPAWDSPLVVPFPGVGQGRGVPPFVLKNQKLETYI